MKLAVLRTNLLENGNIAEGATINVVVPESALEADFFLSWIRYDLRDDLGDCASEELLHKFFRTCEHIRYVNKGRFVFDVSEAVEGFKNTDICFWVHRSRSPETNEHPSRHNEFEIMWEEGGVCQSLYEASIIDDLMKQIR